MNPKVIYWMSRALRSHDNPALYEAQQAALKLNALLEVNFFQVPTFPYANQRNMDFLLKGLYEVSTTLASYHIPLHVYRQKAHESFKDRIQTENIVLIVTEQAVLRPILSLQKDVRILCDDAWIDFKVINTACVVPVHLASPKLEYAAKTFRPKIMSVYTTWLEKSYPLVVHPYTPLPFSSFNQAELSALLAHFDAIPPFKTDLIPGETAALSQLDYFIQNGLANYDRRNEVNAHATSYLSAYLHFGMLAPTEMIRRVKATDHPHAALFIEEALVRRELAENYCHYCKNYDNLNGAWLWARKTLDQHRMDPRPYLYTQEVFEQALTHDPLWNFCQRQVLEKGYLHGYLRMYWAKMVLLWTPDPETALKILVYLNDTYFLDGRDPNGYTGILWSIAGVHDRPWFNKPVNGLIRVMSSEGAIKKTKIKL